jgi:hypothetical protein
MRRKGWHPPNYRENPVVEADTLAHHTHRPVLTKLRATWFGHGPTLALCRLQFLALAKRPGP